MIPESRQCRYLRRSGERCTGEVADPDESILLCTKHLAAAWRMVEDAREDTFDPADFMIGGGEVPVIGA